MLIIPAIDIIENKIVRLTKGNYETVKRYEINLIDQVGEFVDYGFQSIHLIDLAASKDNRITTVNILKEIKQNYEIDIQFGGGIRNAEDVKKIFDTGVARIIIGSLAITNKSELEKIISDYNPEKIVIAVDVLKKSVMIKGWTEDSGINLFDHISYCKSLGIMKYLCTDIEKDGMLKGVSIKLYNEIKNIYPDIYLIASGGVSGIDDLIVLKENSIDACVVGKAIYEGKINLAEMKIIDN